MEGWCYKEPEGKNGTELNQAANQHKRTNIQIKNSESHLELMALISIIAIILCSYQLNKERVPVAVSRYWIQRKQIEL